MSLTIGHTEARRTLAPVVTRGAVVLACLAAAGLAWSQAGAAPALDPEYVRLMRAMAGLKSLMAAAAGVAILWRLAAPVGWAWFTAYAAVAASMAAGPVLIWTMAHIGTGALLLHGGLAAALVLLWRDPATASLLRRAIAIRRGPGRA